jgi:hypothetical protein
MIRVTVELLPHGDESRKRLLGLLYITNDGTGTPEVGNYKGELIAEYTKPSRKGRVVGFNRKRKSVWTLIGMFLKKWNHV